MEKVNEIVAEVDDEADQIAEITFKDETAEEKDQDDLIGLLMGSDDDDDFDEDDEFDDVGAYNLYCFSWRLVGLYFIKGTF